MQGNTDCRSWWIVWYPSLGVVNKFALGCTLTAHPLLAVLGWLKVEVVCIVVSLRDPVLGFRSDSELVFEGCVEADAIMGEEVAERAGPVAPVFRAYFALVGPVVLCCAVWLSFSSVCIWAEVVPTCVCDVGEHDDLKVLPAPVHLIVKFVMFG